jgi:hypothetical protein
MAEPRTPSPPGGILRTLSAILGRLDLARHFGTTFGGLRNVNEVLGYTPTLEYGHYKAKYTRQDLAHRIVRAYPDATWAQPPAVTDGGTPEAPTPFETAWTGLAMRLQIFSKLKRADVLANLGRYSVLLIGLRGQPDLNTPARPVTGPDDVLYIKPYSEEWATITQNETRTDLPTFGQPSMYQIKFDQGKGLTRLVHASRLIHVAEDCLDDDVYGLPRLERVYNLLDDLLKVIGGSAEMFWLDAKSRTALSQREGYAPLSPEESATLTDEMTEYEHGLRSFIRLRGWDAESLNGTVASPEHHVAALLKLIAGAVPIPLRLLIGSEQGVVAGDQDNKAWLAGITRRQQQHAEPNMVRALADRLLLLRALPVPATEYLVTFDNLLSLSEKEQADIALAIANAVTAYAGAGLASTVLTVQEFRQEYLGLSSEPAGGFLDLGPGLEEDV